MSDTDSFIEEVTEEVRRDRLYALMKRWGWIPVLVVLFIVGGTAWREYNAAQDRTRAEALGDAILVALEHEEPSDRLSALRAIETGGQSGAASIVSMLILADETAPENSGALLDQVENLAAQDGAPRIYREIALYKTLADNAQSIDSKTRREGLMALAVAGRPLRLLAEEQIALIEVESGDAGAAMTRLQAIIDDAEVTAGLRRRASQLIVALGGVPDLGGVTASN